MWDERTYDYGGARLAYLESGTGPETLLAFHGFGQHADVFRSLENTFAAQKYRIFSFSLFYHGSHWPYGVRPLEPAFLSDMMEAFLLYRQVGKFSIIAYSIGVKYALVIANRQPDRIKNLVMIAPDGIRLNFWYRIATGTWLARRLFRLSVNQERIFHWIATWGVKLKLIHASTARFALSQLGSVEKRKKVFDTWMVMRKLFINADLLAGSLNFQNVFVIIFLGDRDKIITEDHVQPLTRHLEKKKIILLPAGHHQLIEAAVAWLHENPDSM
ncbi:MAG TPA: alpha/beta hydrolase [Cyclobacteriaceae bacterium]|nr:alpha/beta hydrolase [Cyclobacteriaceae bacterium]